MIYLHLVRYIIHYNIIYSSNWHDTVACCSMLKTDSKYNFQVFGYSTVDKRTVYNRYSAYSSAIGKCRRLNDVSRHYSEVNSGGGKVYFYWAQTFINNVRLCSGPSLLIKTVKLIRRRENGWMKRRVNETRRITRSSAFKVGVILIV